MIVPVATRKEEVAPFSPAMKEASPFSPATKDTAPSNPATKDAAVYPMRAQQLDLEQLLGSPWICLGTITAGHRNGDPNATGEVVLEVKDHTTSVEVDRAMLGEENEMVMGVEEKGGSGEEEGREDVHLEDATAGTAPKAFIIDKGEDAGTVQEEKHSANQTRTAPLTEDGWVEVGHGRGQVQVQRPCIAQ